MVKMRFVVTIGFFRDTSMNYSVVLNSFFTYVLDATMSFVTHRYTFIFVKNQLTECYYYLFSLNAKLIRPISVQRNAFMYCSIRLHCNRCVRHMCCSATMQFILHFLKPIFDTHGMFSLNLIYRSVKVSHRNSVDRIIENKVNWNPIYDYSSWIYQQFFLGN